MTAGDKRNPFHSPLIADGFASGLNNRNREVTRLQSENADLRAARDAYGQNAIDLQAELTNARELLKKLGTEVIQLLTFLEDDFDNLKLEDSSLPISTQQWNKVGRLAADSIAHQPAPAAKNSPHLHEDLPALPLSEIIDPKRAD